MGRWTVTVLLMGLTAGVLSSGCAPTYQDPATGAEARYGWETLEAELEQPIWMVYDAARDAVDEFELKLLRAHLNGIAAEVVALDAHLDTVNIRLEALPEVGSVLTIRVGTFGNKNKSIVLFAQIMEDLVRCEDIYTKYFAPDRVAVE